MGFSRGWTVGDLYASGGKMDACGRAGLTEGKSPMPVFDGWSQHGAPLRPHWVADQKQDSVSRGFLLDKQPGYHVGGCRRRGRLALGRLVCRMDNRGVGLGVGRTGDGWKGDCTGRCKPATGGGSTIAPFSSWILESGSAPGLTIAGNPKGFEIGRPRCRRDGRLHRRLLNSNSRRKARFFPV